MKRRRSMPKVVKSSKQLQEMTARNDCKKYSEMHFKTI